jgi:hypothetical protein
MPSGVWERHTELATLECIRTQCNSEGKVAKYTRSFRPLFKPAFNDFMDPNLGVSKFKTKGKLSFFLNFPTFITEK